MKDLDPVVPQGDPTGASLSERSVHVGLHVVTGVVGIDGDPIKVRIPFTLDAAFTASRSAIPSKAISIDATYHKLPFCRGLSSGDDQQLETAASRKERNSLIIIGAGS